MHSQKNDLPLLTVSQLTQAIKLNLETLFRNIYLQGEISNLKVQSSGHVYFTLKDASAQISAVMFKTETTFLKRIPKAGDHVMVKGEINVYPPRGNYQIVVRELSYMGLGELLQRLEELKIKLHQLGWFKSTHKKPLPRLPLRIGVVTSPTGAVIQDILHILTRRYPNFQLLLNPVKVQGEGAPQEIAQAIMQFNAYNLVDVMIVGRGGGSLEDLWAFNDEIVAEAIFHSRIPIISAVGHETDHCIADYVADVRAPTPSAAAEIVLPEKNQLEEYLQNIRKRMQQSIAHLIKKDRSRLKGLMLHPSLANPFSSLEWRMQKLDDYRIDFDRLVQQNFHMKKQALLASAKQIVAFKPQNQIRYFQQRLLDRKHALGQAMHKKILAQKQIFNQLSSQLDQSWLHQQARRHFILDKNRLSQKLSQLLLHRYAAEKQKLANVLSLLDAFNPKNLLNKGYSILFSEEGAIIKSIHQIVKEQKAKVLLSDGELSVKINKK